MKAYKMKVYAWATIAGLWVGCPVIAMAQNVSPDPATATQQNPPATSASAEEQTNLWLASGFAGSNFGNNAEPASAEFGGSLAYLWRSRVGAELDLGFTPNFQLENNFFGLGEEPQVNTYMANVIAALPLGTDARWLPFVSGGIGAMSLRSSFDDGGGLDAIDGTLSSDDTRFAGNIGAGFMGFSGRWGFKADLRYFRASGTYADPTSDMAGSQSVTTPGLLYDEAGNVIGTTSASASTTTSATSVAGAALSGLHFWRGNVGLAFRW